MYDIGAGRPRLSILILNWNGHSDTSALLRDLDSQLIQTDSHSEVEILVLDNGSDDAVPTWWSSLRSVRVIREQVNLGYSGGMSVLLGRASADICWLLNNDIRLGVDSIERALAHSSSREFAVVFPLVLNPDQSTQSRDCSWGPLRGWITGPSPDMHGPRMYPILGDIFAAPLVAKSVAIDVGLFPDGFHTYGEDLDGSYAIALSGGKAVRDIDWSMTHRKSSSKPAATSVRYRFESQGWRNLVVSTFLNYEFKNFWGIIPMFVRAWIYELLWKRRGQFLRSPEVLRTWIVFPLEVMRLAVRLRPLRCAGNPAESCQMLQFGNCDDFDA